MQTDVNNQTIHETLDASVVTYNLGDSTRIFISLRQLNYDDINTSSFELHQILKK
jgi:hypothetical protein